jgi:hypothetical protein
MVWLISPVFIAKKGLKGTGQSCAHHCEDVSASDRRAFLSQPVTFIREPLRQLAPLLLVSRAIVDFAHLVLIHVVKRAFDDVALEAAAFISKRAARRAETVAHMVAVAVAHSSQRAVERVFRYRTHVQALNLLWLTAVHSPLDDAFRVHCGENKLTFATDSVQLGQHLDCLPRQVDGVRLAHLNERCGQLDVRVLAIGINPAPTQVPKFERPEPRQRNQLERKRDGAAAISGLAFAAAFTATVE